MVQPIMVWMSKALGHKLPRKMKNAFSDLINSNVFLCCRLLCGLSIGLIACSTSRVDTASIPGTDSPPNPQATFSHSVALPAKEPEPSAQPPGPPPPSALLPVTPVRSEPKTKLIEHGSRDINKVALTFDADMTRGMQKMIRNGEMRDQYDKNILEILRAEQVPATFFVTGLWAETYPGLVRSLAADKLFEIENHSYDHAAFSGPCYGLRVLFRADQKTNSIQLAANAIEKHAGVRTSFFRFPGGCHRSGDIAIVAQAGHLAVQWDVVSGDVMHRDPKKIVEDVMDSAKGGSIIVMHLNGAPNTPATAAALLQIIPALRKKGLSFALLRELLK